MKVALVTGDIDPTGGGIKVVVEELSRALEDAGLDVRVFGLGTGNRLTTSTFPEWIGAELVRLPIVGPDTLGFAPTLPHMLQSWAPDLVHLHGLWQYPSWVVLRWHHRTRRPFVVSPHGVLNPAALRVSRHKKALARTLFVDALLSRASGIAVSTDSEARHVEAFCGRTDSFVLPNGVGLFPLPRPIPSTSAPRRNRTMLYLGRLHPTKNLESLLRAWALAKRITNDEDGWTLKIAGWDQGSHATDLQRACVDLGVSHNVEFSPPAFGAEKQKVFLKADGLVLPSLTEGMPITVLEAWACARPVLMTEACNLNCGFEARAALRLDLELSAMARDIVTFWQLTDDERRSMGESGRELVETRFSWSRVAALAKQNYEALQIRNRDLPPS